jgi:catechol 2,3-dioxygenase
MRVQSLGHIVLKVRDLGRSTDFYTRVLGLKEVARRDGQMVFFSIEDNHHDVALVQMAPDAPAAPADATGLAHVAFKIGNDLDTLRAAKDWLESNDVEIDRIHDHVVSQSIYFHDPDGNQLEVFVDGDPQTWRDTPQRVATREPLAL